MIILNVISLNAQSIKGTVFSYDNKTKFPLEFATIHWEGTTISSTSNEKGYFIIDRIKGKKLIASYVGMKTDTIDVLPSTDSVSFTLIPDNMLGAIEIISNQASTQFNTSNVNIEIKINQKELHKAACCNLSESFETNASVDVAYSDAATGSKQIKMLGLAGKYVSISKDNMPNIRGFNTHMGMNFIPGTWIQGIQLTKGIGSVANGHEDLTGQINVQLIQPSCSGKNDYNFYINNEGRIENNLVLHEKINKTWTTNLLLHQNSRLIQSDNNNDNFIDLPVGNQYNVANLWKGITENDWMIHGQINYTYDDKSSGTLSNSSANFPIHMLTHKEDAYLKMGKLYDDHPNRSFGIQISQMHYRHEFSLANSYINSRQNSLIANILFLDIIDNTDHEYKIGLNATQDDYLTDASVSMQTNQTSIQNNIIENKIGAFAEYQYKFKDKLTWILGQRLDYSNLWGLEYTPRTNIRYSINDRFILKASSGTGFRTAFGLTENQSLLLTSRDIINADLYMMEKAWTNGLNLVYKYEIGYRKGTISADYYYTDFIDQLIVDQKTGLADNNIVFYNKDNELINPFNSSTFQFDIFQEVSKRMELRFAYKYSNVPRRYYPNNIVTEIEQDLKTPMHRGFFNLYYKTRSKWEFDYTTQLIGEQVLLNGNSPVYVLHNTQVTKNFKNKNAIYLGVENISNFQQDNAILSWEDPFSENFDATQIWGPVFGRTIYFGMRYHF